MKKLEIDEMLEIAGGSFLSVFLNGAVCAGSIIMAGTATVESFGSALPLVMPLAILGCADLLANS